MKLFIVLAIASFGVVGTLCWEREWEEREEEGLRSGGYGSRGSVIGLSRGIVVGRHREEEGRREEERRREEEERRRRIGEEWGRRGGEGEGRREERYGIGFGGSHFITPVEVRHEEALRLKAHPEFRYDYRVRDHRTKDIKDKHEVREGYKVRGRYSLLEPDRKTVRVVDYTSDKKRGFVAKVSWRRRHE